MRILLVEDHPPLAEALRDGLERAGFAVDHARTAASARALRDQAAPDLVVLDLGLPDGCGLGLLRDWSRRGGLPIIVLTARDTSDDRVRGLDAGADDYVVKPVEMAELVARVRAVLRRPGGRESPVLEAGPLRLNTSSREAELDGRPLPLGRREAGVLEQLLRRPGRVVPRRAIEQALYACDREVTENAVDAAVSRLRRALAAEGAEGLLRTVRGIGWMIAP
jgi:two-component system OmpR family response regulator